MQRIQVVSYLASELFLIIANLGRRYILLSITNKMQRYTVFFITVNALHVPGGFSAHHQELKTVHTASGICQACLLLPLPIAASKLDIGGAVKKFSEILC